MEAEIIEINGKKYTVIGKPEPPKFSPTTNKMLALAAMFYAPIMMPNSKPRYSQGERIDIVKEFALIQEKKSNLSRAKRDWVVWKFNNTYKPVK